MRSIQITFATVQVQIILSRNSTLFVEHLFKKSHCCLKQKMYVPMAYFPVAATPRKCSKNEDGLRKN